jgi:uncharacterized membrane protein YcjF (UPF0283 family)
MENLTSLKCITHSAVTMGGWLTLILFIWVSVTRLEERESDMKKEYNALHQRHTEVGTAVCVCVHECLVSDSIQAARFVS